MRLRRQGAAQPRQGLSDVASLRRAWPCPRPWRCHGVPGYSEVLNSFGPEMTDTFKPDNASQVEDAVRWALDHGKALEVLGGGSKRRIGRPAQTDLTLDLS